MIISYEIGHVLLALDVTCSHIKHDAKVSNMQRTHVLVEIRASQPMINDNKLGNMTRPLELNDVFGTNDNKLGNMYAL